MINVIGLYFDQEITQKWYYFYPKTEKIPKFEIKTQNLVTIFYKKITFLKSQKPQKFDLQVQKSQILDQNSKKSRFLTKIFHQIILQKYYKFDGKLLKIQLIWNKILETGNLKLKGTDY